MDDLEKEAFLQVIEKIVDEKLDRNYFYIKTKKKNQRFVNRQSTISLDTKSLYAELRRLLGPSVLEWVNCDIPSGLKERRKKEFVDLGILTLIEPIAINEVEKLFKIYHEDENKNIKLSIGEINELKKRFAKYQSNALLKSKVKIYVGKAPKMSICKNDAFVCISNNGLNVKCLCESCQMSMSYHFFHKKITNANSSLTPIEKYKNELKEAVLNYEIAEEVVMKFCNILDNVLLQCSFRFDDNLPKTYLRNEIDGILNCLKCSDFGINNENKTVRFFGKTYHYHSILNNDVNVFNSILNEVNSLVSKYNDEVDVAKKKIETISSNPDAKKILHCVNDVEGFGKTTYVNLLKGLKIEKLGRYKLIDNKYFGVLSSYSQVVLTQLIETLIDAHCLETYFSKGDRYKQYPKIRITQKGLEVLNLPIYDENMFDNKNTSQVLEEFAIYDTKRKKQAIVKVLNENINKDFLLIFDFLIKKRHLYKDVVYDFVKIFKNVDSKYIPLIEMNYHVENSVLKQILREILNNIEK